jgi:hypothetical protein
MRGKWRGSPRGRQALCPCLLGQRYRHTLSSRPTTESRT